MKCDIIKYSHDILIVDDDVNTLNALRIVLRDHFSISTASSPEEALNLVASNKGFSIIVSDYHMPEMDGIVFLSQIRDLCPDALRILFTGRADLTVAVNAVNQGQVFRFLIKPCLVTDLRDFLNAGVQEYQSRIAEKDRGRRTAQALANSLLDALRLSSPEAFARSLRVSGIVERMLDHIDVGDRFELVLAARLSLLGCMALPRTVRDTNKDGLPVTSVLPAACAAQALIAANILSHLPQMEPIAALILESGAAPASDLSLKTQILRAAIAYDTLALIDYSNNEIFDRMSKDCTGISVPIVTALKNVLIHPDECVSMLLKVNQLKSGMILEDDIVTFDGLLLLAKNKELNECSILRLCEISRHQKIREPISVLVIS